MITIDGPAASGKTSVSRELAKRLGWNWVSTGAFYRGLAYCAYALNYSLDDEDKLVELAASNRWKVEMTDARTTVFLDGKDVTDEISQEVVGTYASRVSQLHRVRQALLQPQRDCALRAKNLSKGLVAEGRDCGTVVFPNAALKIYLTANQESRAERRAKELGLCTEETVNAQKQRDLQDSTRKAAPLAIPENSFVVDATNLDLKGVVDLIEEEVRRVL